MGVIVGPGRGLRGGRAAAEVVTPAVVIAAGGGAGPVAASVLTFRWRQVSPRADGAQRDGGPGHAGAKGPAPLHGHGISQA
jgi:hypothetical protein